MWTVAGDVGRRPTVVKQMRKEYCHSLDSGEESIVLTTVPKSPTTSDLSLMVLHTPHCHSHTCLVECLGLPTQSSRGSFMNSSMFISVLSVLSLPGTEKAVTDSCWAALYQ